MRRLVLIVLCMILLFTCCGCSSKADKEELEALRQEVASLKDQMNNEEEEENEKAVYFLTDNRYSDRLYITLKELYTNETMMQILEEEGDGHDSAYFFLPDAPKEEIGGIDGYSKGDLFPDTDYSIAFYMKNGDEWEKIR